MDLFNAIIYFTFYLFVLVVGYQYIRERTWRRLMGLHDKTLDSSPSHQGFCHLIYKRDV